MGTLTIVTKTRQLSDNINKELDQWSDGVENKSKLLRFHRPSYTILITVHIHSQVKGWSNKRPSLKYRNKPAHWDETIADGFWYHLLCTDHTKKEKSLQETGKSMFCPAPYRNNCLKIWKTVTCLWGNLYFFHITKLIKLPWYYCRHIEKKPHQKYKQEDPTYKNTHTKKFVTLQIKWNFPYLGSLPAYFNNFL